MPTYDYVCDACGHRFEQFQSMKADPLKVCPECKKSKLRRLIGAGAALIFKGSGFYITDYRDSAYNDKAKADAGASGGDAKPDKPAGDSAATAATPATPAKSAEATPAAKAEPAPAAKPTPKSKGGSKPKSE